MQDVRILIFHLAKTGPRGERRCVIYDGWLSSAMPHAARHPADSILEAAGQIRAVCNGDIF
jgi:hypothetical protein